MEVSLQILTIAIFIGVTIAYYRKPRTEAERIWKKIPHFSRMINGVIYDPRQAHSLLAYRFATSWSDISRWEKAAFKLNENDEIFFVLTWWWGNTENNNLYIFENKQSFLDEIYNHWGVELHNQINEFLPDARPI